MSRGGSSECRIYVGNLPPDIREKELDDLFYKYGNIKHIDLKNKRGFQASLFTFTYSFTNNTTITFPIDVTESYNVAQLFS